MLARVDSFYDWLEISETDRLGAEPVVREAAERAEGMTAPEDYHALAAALLHCRPKNIFEIGTYRGVTSDFFLALLPESRVVSIAYVSSDSDYGYNNTDLSREEVGAAVRSSRRSRYVQLIGDSHELRPVELQTAFGWFDLVFIDGDHSRAGVEQDTNLAGLITRRRRAAICWHDANPKQKYLDVRHYLESQTIYDAIATSDTYVGGVAYWSRDVAKKLMDLPTR